MKLILVGVVAIIIVAAIYLRRRSAHGKQPEDPHSLDDSRFHAVSIHYSEGACTVAKTLAGQRFLAEDAPKLPLPGCDARQCNCRFTHYDDRRSTPERRAPFGGMIYGGTAQSRLKERRKGKNRRSDAEDDSD